MRSKWTGVFGGLVLLAIASAVILATPGQNHGFSISAFPPTATARPGATANYTAVIDSQGFSGQVILTCQSTSRGAPCSVSPSSVKLSPGSKASAAVTAVADGNAQKGSYQLTITATPDNIGAQESTTVTLLVN
jgi:hypothetical protein